VDYAVFLTKKEKEKLVRWKNLSVKSRHQVSREKEWIEHRMSPQTAAVMGIRSMVAAKMITGGKVDSVVKNLAGSWHAYCSITYTSAVGATLTNTWVLTVTKAFVVKTRTQGVIMAYNTMQAYCQVADQNFRRIRGGVWIQFP